MTSQMRVLWVALIAVAIVSIGAMYLVLNASQKLGGATNYDEVDATALKVGGANGSRLGPIISTTCNLSQASPGSHAATTTKQYFCAITGVAANDTVLVSLPLGAGSASGFGGILINGAYATTSGAIGVDLYNGSGAATSSITQATTSVAVTVFHPVTSVPGL